MALIYTDRRGIVPYSPQQSEYGIVRHFCQEDSPLSWIPRRWNVDTTWREARLKYPVEESSVAYSACRCAWMNCEIPPHVHSARAHSGHRCSVSCDRHRLKEWQQPNRLLLRRRLLTPGLWGFGDALTGGTNPDVPPKL